jgi:hypothetical protein
MIRSARLLILSLALIVPPALAAAQNATTQTRTKASTRRRTATKKKTSTETSDKPAAAAKPDQIGTFGSWEAYVTSGTNPTCYVLSQPQQRAPASLKRDPAYVFISTRPAEHVRNEVSIIMGFVVKDDGSAPPTATVGSTKFAMVAKDSDLWLKDDSQDGVMIAAMRKGDKMIVKAASLRGNVSTDSYSLSGLNQALDHALKSCK